MTEKPCKACQMCCSCTYWDDYLEPGKCYADLEYHEPEDTCCFWAGTLRSEPLHDAPMKAKEDCPLNSLTGKRSKL